MRKAYLTIGLAALFLCSCAPTKELKPDIGTLMELKSSMAIERKKKEYTVNYITCTDGNQCNCPEGTHAARSLTAAKEGAQCRVVSSNGEACTAKAVIARIDFRKERYVRPGSCCACVNLEDIVLGSKNKDYPLVPAK